MFSASSMFYSKHLLRVEQYFVLKVSLLITQPVVFLRIGLPKQGGGCNCGAWLSWLYAKRYLVRSMASILFAFVPYGVLSHTFSKGGSKFAELLLVFQRQFLHCCLKLQLVGNWWGASIYHFVRVVAFRACRVVKLTTIHFLLKLSDARCTSNPVFQLRWHRVILPHKRKEVFNHQRDHCFQTDL